MSNLSEKDLALLSTIIYSDHFVTRREGESLQNVVDKMLNADNSFWNSIKFSGDFAHLEKNHERGRQEAIDRFKDVLKQVQASPNLQHIKIVEPMLRDGMGITAATFVDTRDNSATVVFRGTDGSYKAWYDNFEGAGTDKYTPMQKLALDYMERIAKRGYNNVTVTGHSKGGNLAAFVTLFSPIVSRCINFDGQGFSEYFHKKFKDEIDANRNKIKTIAAYNDFVNILMFTIAGETVYVNNNNDNFAERHYMSNIVRDNTFDDDGNFTSTRPQESSMRILENGLDLLLILLPPGVEEWFTDTFGPILSLILGKGDVTADDLLHALTNLAIGAGIASLFPALAVGVIVLVVAVLLVVAVAILIDWAIDAIINVINAVIDKLAEIAKNIGEWIVNVVNSIKEAIGRFVQWLRDLWNRAGREYAAANPHFKADTAKLLEYANRVNNVNNRLRSLDRSLRRVFLQVSALDMLRFAWINFLTSGSPSLNKVKSYLETTASRLETADNKARVNMGG